MATSQFGGLFMMTFLIIISILLIAVVLLQAGKAESAMGALTGGNDSLFNYYFQCFFGGFQSWFAG